MREFFHRLWVGLRNLAKRFATNRPNNPYELVVFGAIREAASIYTRRVIVV